ncbi:MAG TPA: ElyC/SanA/YdcF family protein [Gaiellaceae bacterium]|nr:ElyC/SanA/YdcF family protein [Gaiellaceae bacterium]
MTRLVAVLGYSDGSTADLHAVAATRVRRAAAETQPDDVVLFSGWARAARGRAEADLMAARWTAPARARLVDRGARTTLGNAIAVARAARWVGATEVVLVTSSWHAHRAAALVRASLVRSGAQLTVAATDEPVTSRRMLREVAAWAAVPVLALVAVRSR